MKTKCIPLCHGLNYFCHMNLSQRFSALLMLCLFLGLTFGIEVYRVKCHMRSEHFLSFSSGMDPCLIENEASNHNNHSCCAIETKCLEDSDIETHCCDEEAINISYEPDAFSQFKLSIPQLYLVENNQLHFISHVISIPETPILSEYSRPPPLDTNQILSLHCVWRI